VSASYHTLILTDDPADYTPPVAGSYFGSDRGGAVSCGPLSIHARDLPALAVMLQRMAHKALELASNEVEA
jgi:hypothetical protein